MTSIPNGNIENTNELASELKTYLNPDTKINLRGPSTSDKVYKDECVYCFDTPFSTGKAER
jgi:uncharacterized UBP type Zn finger protein